MFPSFAVALFIVPGESSSVLSTIREPASRKCVGEFLNLIFFSFGWWNAMFSLRLFVIGSLDAVSNKSVLLALGIDLEDLKVIVREVKVAERVWV
jgi:hypothetical protein